MEIDNNVAEREMKRIAIGRKNYLFVGSANGGHTAAVPYSFTSTCHRLGAESWPYLQDVLQRLPGTPAEGLRELLPDHGRRHATKQSHNLPLTPRRSDPSPSAIAARPLREPAYMVTRFAGRLLGVSNSSGL